MNSFSKFIASISALIAALSLAWIAYTLNHTGSQGIQILVTHYKGIGG